MENSEAVTFPHLTNSIISTKRFREEQNTQEYLFPLASVVFLPGIFLLSLKSEEDK